MRNRGLIIGLGTSPEPVACSIAEHRPEFVCFFTSQQSVEQVPLVRQRADHQFEDHKVIVRYIEDLQHCYERALHCCRLVEERGLSPEDVVVDYTGGTKPMSAALVLATVTRGYRFSYVGGSQRDPEKRGVVVDGFSELRRSENPWDVMAVRGLEHVSWAFNRNAFSLALLETERLLSHRGLSPRIRHLLGALTPLITAYMHWDRFEHRSIGDHLKNGYHELTQVVELTELGSLEPMLTKVQQNLEFYNAFRQGSKNFQPDAVTSHHVSDLVANACRRAGEEKFDDAIARLYRALEMRAQVALATRGIKTGAVRPGQVPETLREEFVLKYGSDGDLRVPLHAAYRLLQALDDPVASAYFTRESEVTKILSSRNASILAHGCAAQTRGAFESFLATVSTLLEHPCPDFPQLNLSGLF